MRKQMCGLMGIVALALAGFVQSAKADSHWPLNETTGTLVHDLTGGNNGTLSTQGSGTMPTWLPTGGPTHSGALSLVAADASDGGYISFSGAFVNSATLYSTGMTYSVWINTTASSGSIIGQAPNNSYNYYGTCGLRIFGGQAQMVAYDTTACAYVFVNSISNINTGVWTHVAGVFNPTDQKMHVYVNGIEEGRSVAIASMCDPAIANAGRSTKLSIPECWTGQLSDVRVYCEQLSEQQIQALTYSMVGWYTFNQSSGSTVADISGSNNTATLTVDNQSGGILPTFAPNGIQGGSPADSCSFNTSDDTDVGYLSFSSGFVNAATLYSAGMTYSVWINTTASSGSIVGQSPNNSYNYYGTCGLRIYGGPVQMITYDDTACQYVTVTSVSNVNTGVWTHVAGVFNPTDQKMHIYVNGTEEGTPAAVVSMCDPALANAGRSTKSATYPSLADAWVGDIDELRVCSRALTATEIKRIAGFPTNNVLFVGITASQLTQLWQNTLANMGWTYSFASWGGLTSDYVKTCNLVALMSLPAEPGIITVSPADVATCAMLQAYVNGGGGLLLDQSLGESITTETVPLYLANLFGTKLLVQQFTVTSPAPMQIGALSTDVYSYTTNINSALSTGVPGVLYPTFNSPTVFVSNLLPFETNNQWLDGLDAGAYSSSANFPIGLPAFDSPTGQYYGNPFSQNVPLIGIRDAIVGQSLGRVGYNGIDTSMVFWRADAEGSGATTYNDYMDGTYNGYTSNLKQFYVNLFQWLAANSASVATTALASNEVPDPYAGCSTAFQLFKGLIGPMATTYSGGTSRVSDYAAAAQAQGLNFLVLLADYNLISAANYQNLENDCAACSTNTFLVVPGLAYTNTDGNNEFAFGSSVLYPSSLFFNNESELVWPSGTAGQAGQSITDLVWLYSLLGFYSHSGWYGFNNNPYPYYDSRDTDAMGAVYQYGGLTLEDNATVTYNGSSTLSTPYGLQQRCGQYCWPIAVTQMNSASDIGTYVNATTGTGTYYYNVVGANGMAALASFLNGTITNRSGYSEGWPQAGMVPFGTTYLSNGPDIATLTLNKNGAGSPETTPYSQVFKTWGLNLTVNALGSGRTLTEILIMDGDQVFRRLKPNTATFTYSTTFPEERQKYIWVQATDSAGKRCITRNFTIDSILHKEFQCGDRNNQLVYGEQPRPNPNDEATYGDFVISNPGTTAIPTKGPWEGNTRPVNCFDCDPRLGMMNVVDGQTGLDPYVALDPFITNTDGSIPAPLSWSYPIRTGIEGAPHVQATRILAGPEVHIGEFVMDGVFGQGSGIKTDISQVWHTLYPTEISNLLNITATRSFYRPASEGIMCYLWNETFTTKESITISSSAPYAFGMGMIYSGGTIGYGASDCVLVYNSGAHTIGPESKGSSDFNTTNSYTLNRGDYLAFLKGPSAPSNCYGSLVVYSLADGTVLKENGGIEATIGVGATYVGKTIPASKPVSGALLLVGINDLVTDLTTLKQFADGIRAYYGLATGTPSYTLTVSNGQGSITSRRYTCLLAAQSTNKCFVGTFGNLGTITAANGDTVSANLPIQLTGLRSNWSACFQRQSATPLTRLIPVDASGNGYASIGSEENGYVEFIGHPFLASNSSVQMTLSEAADGHWQLEVANPTNNQMTGLHIWNNPYALNWSLNVTGLSVGAGQSVFYNLGTAGE